MACMNVSLIILFQRSIECLHESFSDNPLSNELRVASTNVFWITCFQRRKEWPPRILLGCFRMRKEWFLRMVLRYPLLKELRVAAAF